MLTTIGRRRFRAAPTPSCLEGWSSTPPGTGCYRVCPCRSYRNSWPSTEGPVVVSARTQELVSAIPWKDEVCGCWLGMCAHHGPRAWDNHLSPRILLASAHARSSGPWQHWERLSGRSRLWPWWSSAPGLGYRGPRGRVCITILVIMEQGVRESLYDTSFPSTNSFIS